MAIRLKLARWMTTARRHAASLAALTFLLGSISGCENPAKPGGGAPAGGTAGAGGTASGKVRRVIMMTNGADPFWDAMRAGMSKAEKDFGLASVKLQAVMDVGDGTSAAQIDKLKNYANQTDVAAVTISATDAKSPALADAMRNLRKQGIHVITIDSDVERGTVRDARFAYLGTDNIVGGRQMGLAAKGIRPTGGKYAAFVGLKSAANAKERHDGFAEGAGDKFKELEYMGDEMDLAVAQKNVQDAISRNKEIDTFVGIWGYNANAIVQALEKEPDIRKRSLVVVFDASPLALKHMADGKIDAMIVQNPYDMGYKGVQLMKALVGDDGATVKKLFPGYDPQSKKFGKPEDDIHITELRVVAPDKNESLKQEMFDKGTVFFKLSGFQEWLKERGLTGS